MTSEGQQTSVAEETQQPATSEKKRPTRKVASKPLVLPQTITVKRLAELTRIGPIDTIKQLMRNGVMVSMNQVIDFEIATLVTSAYGIKVELEKDADPVARKERKTDGAADSDMAESRAPVVTILGHVDHGKTTLLDTIRSSRVAESEVGSITQHIGAYQVNYNGHDITFLDTPGHEAFTAIRARGARATDIAILVVAADDGVMPQTVEALDHAKAAGVPIVVAINKMDRPEADADRVKRQLGEQGLILEEWGGETITVPISASQGDGITELLENLLVVAEVSDLKADLDLPATGVVIETKLDRNRGPLATVLVQNGTLRVGDYVTAGGSMGRVRALVSDVGERVKQAAPSVPVEVMGFDTQPEAGDTFTVEPDEKTARQLAGRRLKEMERSASRGLTMDEIYTRMSAGDVKELNLIVKADVQGSVEAVCSALMGLDDGRARVRILHAASGAITESDILLASASKAIITGFNTTTQQGCERLADRAGVEIRHYAIIYRLVEDVENALKGILESTYRDVVQGHAEVRAIFSLSRRGKVAGCMVVDGRITKGSALRVIRNGEIIHEGSISGLRHFKEDVNEMAAGFECGVSLGSYNDFAEGDILETHRRERMRA